MAAPLHASCEPPFIVYLYWWYDVLFVKRHIACLLEGRIGVLLKRPTH